MLDGLTLSRQTRLYDGVIQAVDVAGTEGQRSLLVLSDGADTSETPIEAATTAIKDAEVLVDVVALEQNGKALEALQQLADGRPGPGDLVRSGRPAGRVRRRGRRPRPPGAGHRDAAVGLRQDRGHDQGHAADVDRFGQRRGVLRGRAGRHAARPRPRRGLRRRGRSYAGPGALALGLVFLVVLLVPRKQAQLSAADRVTRYTEIQAAGGSSEAGGPLLDADVTFASAKETAANVLRRNKDLDARISARLQGAGSELKSSEWLLVHGGLFFLSGPDRPAAGRRQPARSASSSSWSDCSARGSTSASAAAGAARRSTRGLPDTLQLMSGSLAAGLSLAQSIDTIVREGAEPIASEFRRVLVETRLGVSLEDALEGVAERFDSKDFEWVVMAIKIQRQVGGNLAELLDTVAATMREREYVRRQVAALAAEGKLSAWVLGGLPPLFMVYLLLTNYDYVIVMFQEPSGLGDAGRCGNHPRRRGVLDEPTGQGGGVRWPSSSCSA